MIFGTQTWKNVDQLVDKKIFKDKNDTKENVSRNIIGLLTNNDKYNILWDEMKDNIYNNLVNCDILFSTPILVAAVSQYKSLLSSCYLLKIDSDNDLQTFISEFITLLQSGGFGVNISSLFKPLVFIEIIKWIVLFYRGKYSRISVATVCVEMFHFEFLQILDYFDILKSNLNISLHINITFPDLFYEKVIKDEEWYFLDYDEATYNSLKYSFGEEFTKIYENTPKNETRKIRARDLFTKLINYLAINHNAYTWSKDAANLRTQFNNQTITTTNLCLEIIQPVCKNHSRSYCTLGQVNLANMITAHGSVDYQKIGSCVRSLVYSLSIITNDLSQFLDYRDNPHDIAIGVSGFYNLISTLGISYLESIQIHWNIFQTIYYYAVKTSHELHLLNPPDHQSFKVDKFSYELCEIDYTSPQLSEFYNPLTKFGLMYDFESLRGKRIYNRRLTAMMPTSTTSEILGNFQSCHGPFSKDYVRESRVVCERVKSKDNFHMGQLTLKQQLMFTFHRQFFLDNTQSNEIFYHKTSNSQLTDDLAEYYILSYFLKIPTICYYFRVNNPPNNYKNTSIQCEACSL